MAVASLNPLEAPPPSLSFRLLFLSLSLSRLRRCGLVLACLGFAGSSPLPWIPRVHCVRAYIYAEAGRPNKHPPTARRSAHRPRWPTQRRQRRKKQCACWAPPVTEGSAFTRLTSVWGWRFFFALPRCSAWGRQPTARTGSLARGTPRLPLVEGVYTRGNRGNGLFLGLEETVLSFRKKMWRQMKPLR